jgi:ABC-2 type transport system permease protein
MQKRQLVHLSSHNANGTLTALPALLVTNLISFNVIHASLGLALAFAAALLLVDGLGWRIASAMFDRERLMTGTRS